MISYYKYTAGEAFTTLSGVDYSGYFNIQDNKAYTGKMFSTSSELLSAKKTFLANAFLNKKQFDRTTELPLSGDILKQPEISPKNVIDQTFLDTNFGILNDNNINLYGLNLISNIDIIDFKNAARDGNGFFLGLSSTDIDGNPPSRSGYIQRDDDTQLRKENSFVIQIDPFKDVSTLANINILDDIVDGVVLVYNDESYNYFASSTTNTYTFSGSFAEPLTGGRDNTLIRTGKTEGDDFQNQYSFADGCKFVYDNNTNVLYTIHKNTTTPVSYTITLYDNSFLTTCSNLTKMDQIKVNDDILDGTIQIGNNLKGYIINNGNTVIELSNKYSQTSFDSISALPGQNILAFDIRDTDDAILIITESGNEEVFNLYNVDAADIKPLSNYTPLSCNRISLGAYLYPSEDTGTTVKYSENDSNIFYLTDRGIVTTRYISNPEEVAGFPTTDSMMYLPPMFFGETNERFGKIKKKFNSNKLKSNYFNTRTFNITQNRNGIYYFVHNIGRIYLFKTTNKLVYENFVPLDLKTSYRKTVGCESSLGTTLNSEVQSIINDTLSVFLNLSILPQASTIDGIPTLSDYKSYTGIDINFRDLEFHDNEQVSYNVVTRVFNKLFQLQQDVFNNIIKNK